MAVVSDCDCGGGGSDAVTMAMWRWWRCQRVVAVAVSAVVAVEGGRPDRPTGCSDATLYSPAEITAADWHRDHAGSDTDHRVHLQSHTDHRVHLQSHTDHRVHLQSDMGRIIGPANSRPGRMMDPQAPEVENRVPEAAGEGPGPLRGWH